MSVIQVTRDTRIATAWTGRRCAGLWLAPLVAFAVACGGGSKAEVEQTPQMDVSKSMQLAQSLMRAGRVGEAMETLDEAVALEPDNARLWQFYGETCMRGGLNEPAREAFLEALRLDPYLTDAHLYLGFLFQETDDLAAAEKHYRLALENPAYPQPEKIYLGLGKLYEKQQRLAEAEQNLRTSVGIDPKFYLGHFELAGILEQQGNLAEAASEYEVAGPGFGNDAQYHYRVGFLYFRVGDRFQAREHLERAVDIAPGSSVAAKSEELLRMMD